MLWLTGDSVCNILRTVRYKKLPESQGRVRVCSSLVTLLGEICALKKILSIPSLPRNLGS